MLPPLSEEVGEIKIDVYKASLVKSNRGTKSSERTSLPAITAHVTELGGVSQPFYPLCHLVHETPS